MIVPYHGARVKGDKGDQGDQGAAGQQGPPGQVGQPGAPGQFILDNWINSTRQVDPGKDLVGYNREEKRIEFFIDFEKKWYYLWQGLVGAVPPPAPPVLFSDDFQTGWFMDNPFIQVAADTFETGWFENNPFALLGADSFDSGWFTSNIFNLIFNETFEGAW